jgi:hypothetical protein
MNMDALERNGKPQTWLKPGTLITHDRTITAIQAPAPGSAQGARITLDAPLSDSFDAAYLNPPGTTVARYAFRSPRRNTRCCA